MKKISLLIALVALVVGTAAITKKDGRAGATGSPGETTCNTSQCHNSFPLNSGGGSIVITAPTLTNWAYIPGQVYPISVTVSKTGINLFGLGFEALRSTGANGGTLSITSPTQTQIKTAVVNGNSRNNVVHTLNGGTSSNSHTFTFNWTAPLTNIGNITFYAAGNAANGNNSASNDYVYTTSQVITFTTGIQNPDPVERSFAVYPNPVQEKFQVTFTQEVQGPVEINLYDIRGRLEHTLISEILPTGSQELSVTLPESVSPGIHFVQLTVGGKLYSRKIVRL